MKKFYWLLAVPFVIQFSTEPIPTMMVYTENDGHYSVAGSTTDSQFILYADLAEAMNEAHMRRIQAEKPTPTKCCDMGACWERRGGS